MSFNSAIYVKRVPILGDYTVRFYEMVLYQIKHANLGQIMNFYVRPPSPSERDTVAFIHLRTSQDNITLKNILNNMFFYDSFLQVSLNQEVVNQMVADEKLKELSGTEQSIDESKHDVSSNCDCERCMLRSDVQELTNKVKTLETELQRTNEMIKLEVVSKNIQLVPSRGDLEGTSEEEELESLRREIRDLNNKMDTIERRQFRLYQLLKD